MRDDAQVQETIAAAEATMEAARCYVYRTLEELWTTLCAEEKPCSRQRTHYRLMMTHAHHAAVNALIWLLLFENHDNRDSMAERKGFEFPVACGMS
jgi:hypothetical protein